MKFIIIKKFTFLLINLLLISSFAYATTESLDGIAAKVNEDIITINQLNQQVAIAKQQLTSQHIQLPTEKVLKKQVLDMMITQVLQLQVAKRVDLTVTDKQVKEALANIATSQNTTPQGLVEAMRQQGLSVKELLAQIKDQLIISKLQKEAILSTITITPMEVNTYMRSIKKQDNALLYHLEDLVISVPKTPTPEQIKKIEQRAEDLIKKLKAGTDFKSLAVAESTGQTALQGGDLGWYSLAELPATFSSAIQNMKIGDISQPIRANDGIHILSLLGVRSNKNANAKITDSKVKNSLLRRKFEEHLYNWLQQLHATSYIEIMLPL